VEAKTGQKRSSMWILTSPPPPSSYQPPILNAFSPSTTSSLLLSSPLLSSLHLFTSPLLYLLYLYFHLYFYFNLYLYYFPIYTSLLRMKYYMHTLLDTLDTQQRSLYYPLLHAEGCLKYRNKYQTNAKMPLVLRIDAI
jgi:hypothetical protein